jgi:hypothetical protein
MKIMKKQEINIKPYYSLVLGVVLMLSGCIQMSEIETDALVGMNGGFEVSKNGLPVNWLMYTPTTVPDADFVIELDKDDFKEGTQSLRFDVKKCSSIGGWHSPGFTNEFFETGRFEGESIYKLSFWIKNNGTTFNISGGSVAAKEGDMKTLIEDNEQIDAWKLLEYEIEVPKDRWLRIQLNILQPGTFWIDDIKIKKI